MKEQQITIDFIENPDGTTQITYRTSGDTKVKSLIVALRMTTESLENAVIKHVEDNKPLSEKEALKITRNVKIKDLEQ